MAIKSHVLLSIVFCGPVSVVVLVVCEEECSMAEPPPPDVEGAVEVLGAGADVLGATLLPPAAEPLS